jgi:hypothetical protein
MPTRGLGQVELELRMCGYHGDPECCSEGKSRFQTSVKSEDGTESTQEVGATHTSREVR